MGKIRVGLVFGGRSGEYEVSVRSAASIREYLDKEKYEIVEVFVDKEGKIDIDKMGQVDVVFPIIHGTYGEDGCLQGLLEVLDVAYVGAGVLGSAVGMDKDVMKRLLRDAGLKIANYRLVRTIEELNNLEVEFPCFVKPANMGSSVGVSKVAKKEGLEIAVKEALQYDTKVLVEDFVDGREIEVSVLGNDEPKASLPGEIKPKHEFYDYEAKYIDENGASLKIPAKISAKMTVEMQDVAVKAFKTLECSGMARVDMFLRPSGEVVINEINTLPGFTSISMYPKLWEASGLPYSKLIDRLIELAVEKKQQRDNLKRSYGS